MAALRRKKRDGEDAGFTLIELLVVITILGILAAIVVFAVNGIGDKGLQSSVATDAATVRTAEEADCSQNGHFDLTANLVPGLLATKPTYNGVVFYNSPSGGACSLAGTPADNAFQVGSSSFAQTSGPIFFAAANNTPGFSFLDSSFSATNGPNQFSFGASSTLVATATATTPAPTPLFASADEANVNKAIPNGTAAPGVNDPPGVTGSPGTCTAVNCAGIAATKQEYTVGNLVEYSCTSGGQTLAPAAGAPTCKASVNGFPAALTSMADLVNRLAGNAALKVAIATPGTVTCTSVTTTGDGFGTPVTPTTPPAAPYGVAAMQALTSSTTVGGGGMSCTTFNADVTSGQIKEGSNVTATQTLVVGGTTDFALIPKSFVVAPTGNDTDPFVTVPATADTPIRQWAVVVDDANPADVNLGQAFLNYVTSAQGQAVLAAYGYSPIS